MIPRNWMSFKRGELHNLALFVPFRFQRGSSLELV